MKSLLAPIALLLISGLSSFTQEASAQAYIVKNGSFNLCEDVTVEDLVDNFVYNPEWESLVGDDLNRYVNLYGVINYAGVDVDMTLQFILDGLDSFEVNAMEFNGVPQGEDMVLELIVTMCDDYYE